MSKGYRTDKVQLLIRDATARGADRAIEQVLGMLHQRTIECQMGSLDEGTMRVLNELFFLRKRLHDKVHESTTHEQIEEEKRNYRRYLGDFRNG